MQTFTPPTTVDAPAPKSHKRRNIVIGSVVGLFVLGGIASANKQPTDTATPAAVTTPADAASVGSAVTAVVVAPVVTVAPATTPAVTVAPVTVPVVTVPPTPAETRSQANAREKTESYLDFTAFSETGLVKQLEFEGFSTDDAIYGVAAVTMNGIDWNEQAAKKAESYLELTSFSHSGLVDQLVFEGFTPDQAEYGAASTGL